MLNHDETKAINACLAEEEQQSKVMRTTTSGAQNETMSSAIGKGLAKGFSLLDLLKAAAVGYATGGYAGAIAAVLQLILSPAPATP